MGFRTSAFWDRGFESHMKHGYLSLASVVCCHVEVLATGCSLVQRSPTERGVSECGLETSKRKRPRHDLGSCATGKI
jgi:hypothetical protein